MFCSDIIIYRYPVSILDERNIVSPWEREREKTKQKGSSSHLLRIINSCADEFRPSLAFVSTGSFTADRSFFPERDLSLLLLVSFARLPQHKTNIPVVNFRLRSCHAQLYIKVNRSRLRIHFGEWILPVSRCRRLSRFCWSNDDIVLRSAKRDKILHRGPR